MKKTNMKKTNMKKNIITTTLLIALAIITTLTTPPLIAQVYHEECKEDLRIFLRQGTNFEKLRLSEEDTLS